MKSSQVKEIYNYYGDKTWQPATRKEESYRIAPRDATLSLTCTDIGDTLPNMYGPRTVLGLIKIDPPIIRVDRKLSFLYKKKSRRVKEDAFPPQGHDDVIYVDGFHAPNLREQILYHTRTLGLNWTIQPDLQRVLDQVAG